MEELMQLIELLPENMQITINIRRTTKKDKNSFWMEIHKPRAKTEPFEFGYLGYMGKFYDAVSSAERWLKAYCKRQQGEPKEVQADS